MSQESSRRPGRCDCGRGQVDHTGPMAEASNSGGRERRNARRYLLALAASLVGNSAMTLVAGIWVKSLTGSDSVAGAVAVAIYAPSLAAPLMGAWVDRVRRRPFLIAVNVASAAALLPLLLVRTADDVWIIFVVMVAYGVSLVVVDPAENALFAVMFRDEMRQRINGLRLALQEGGKVVAPLLGAGLFALVGGGAVAALDAATFLLAAVAVSRLELSEPASTPPTSPWRTELAAGVRHLRAVPALRTVTLAAAVSMVLAGIATPTQYALVDALGREPSYLGVLTGVLGAGSVVAGLTSAWVISRIGERRLAVWGLVNGAIGWSLYATARLPLVLTGAAILGFTLPWIVVAIVNLAMRRTPDELQGRMSAALTMALFAPQPAAQAVGSVAVGALPYQAIYLAVAGAAIVTAVWLARRPDQ